MCEKQDLFNKKKNWTHQIQKAKPKVKKVFKAVILPPVIKNESARVCAHSHSQLTEKLETVAQEDGNQQAC